MVPLVAWPRPPSGTFAYLFYRSPPTRCRGTAMTTNGREAKGHVL